jgi:hypothetical protein
LPGRYRNLRSLSPVDKSSRARQKTLLAAVDLGVEVAGVQSGLERISVACGRRNGNDPSSWQANSGCSYILRHRMILIK